MDSGNSVNKKLIIIRGPPIRFLLNIIFAFIPYHKLYIYIQRERETILI